MKPSLKSPQAKRALYLLAMRRTEETGNTITPEKLLMEWFLPAGLSLAAVDTSKSEKRKIRIGEDWIVDDSGRICEVSPGELSLYEFRRWMFQEAYKNATQTVLDDVCISPMVIESDDLLSDTPSVEDVNLALGEKERPSQRVDALNALATPKEREVLKLLKQHFVDSEDDLQDVEIARKLNLEYDYFRQVKSRLRKKS